MGQWLVYFDGGVDYYETEDEALKEAADIIAELKGVYNFHAT